MDGARRYYPFGLFIQTREENEIFDKYHDGGQLQYMTIRLITCTCV